MAYPIESPGRLGSGKALGELTKPGDGLAVDASGNIYVTQPSESRIQVLAPDGKSLDSIRVPESPSNCALGGADFKTLFITARTSVYTVQVQRPGVGKKLQGKTIALDRLPPSSKIGQSASASQSDRTRSILYLGLRRTCEQGLFPPF